MTKFIIIDDEHIAHDIIKRYCEQLPEMQFEKSCYDAIEALEFLNENPIDLIFLDLNMPKLKGFDFLKTLVNAPQVIVTTAYKEFALEGYELNVVDYLLKPFSFARLVQALNKTKCSSRDNIVSANPTHQSNTNTIFLNTNKKHVQIEIRKILYLESAGNYVKVITSEETITVRDKISDLLNKFQDDNFVKVHKSFAVAKSHIKSIEGNRIFLDQYIVPIGKKYKSNLDELLK